MPADPIPESSWQPSAYGVPGWRALGMMLLLSVLALAADVPLSRAMVLHHLLVRLDHLLESFAPFGQPPAVIAVSLAIFLCARSRRGVAFRIAACGLLPGLAADLVKLFVARVRPRAFDFAGTVWDTFRGAFPGTAAGSSLQSFPSGHTAVAVGFCLGLTAAFPKGRWLFGVLAGLVALQRVECGAHFLSDTLGAAALGCAAAIIVFGPGPVSRWFTWLEARCERNSRA